MTAWTFLSNHAHVLVCLHEDPSSTIASIAARVGITPRGVQKIIADLALDGYLEVRRSGRRNAYVLAPSRPLRHPLESHHTVGELLEALAPRRT